MNRQIMEWIQNALWHPFGAKNKKKFWKDRNLFQASATSCKWNMKTNGGRLLSLSSQKVVRLVLILLFSRLFSPRLLGFQWYILRIKGNTVLQWKNQKWDFQKLFRKMEHIFDVFFPILRQLSILLWRKVLNF